MSNYRRARVTGASYFFTVNLAQRGGCLLIDSIDDLRAAFSLTMAERPFICDAFVVLPDHIHAVWTLPKGDADFSGRWRLIKGRFAHRIDVANPRRASMVKKREKGVWQRRFWEHMIRDECDYHNHMEYCWGNPVKHGFVERSTDWPFSSIHREIARGMIPPEWNTKKMA